MTSTQRVIQPSPLVALYRHRLGAEPVVNIGMPHRFRADPLANVQNQCTACWGWYDDTRHV